jgi:hypothetical protein
LSVVVEIALAQAAFEVGARVDAGRGVRLEEHQVAAKPVGPGTKEVIEPNLEQIGRAGVARDVATEFAEGAVGLDHHRQRVPARDRRQPLLDREVALERRLRMHGNGVDVRRAERRHPAQSQRAAPLHELVEHEARTRRAGLLHQRQQRIAPFGSFLWIAVGMQVARLGDGAQHGMQRVFGHG